MSDVVQRRQEPHRQLGELQIDLEYPDPPNNLRELAKKYCKKVLLVHIFQKYGSFFCYDFLNTRHLAGSIRLRLPLIVDHIMFL